MHRRSLIVCGIATFTLAIALLAQRSATTSLVVRIDPESHWSPPQIALNFRVSADGEDDVTTQVETVTARVRSLPDRSIHLTATAGAISGPSGVVPPSALAWRGSMSGSAAEGRKASCTSGSFASGPTQDLAADWNHSGVLACAVSFSLANPRTLAPGMYTATVTFNVAP